LQTELELLCLVFDSKDVFSATRCTEE